MSKWHLCICATLTLLATPQAMAENFSDPTWPCVQRKVDNLSVGLMWPVPIVEGELRPDIGLQAQQLADTLVLRRVSLDAADSIIADFVAANADLTDADLGHIFQAAFTRINRNRGRLIAGISRYSLTQIDLAARIEAARVEMDQQMAKDAPDFDRVDVLEEQLDWDQRIFRDRAQSLTYVCETPVLLEKRAFAIAQVLGQYLQD